MQPNPYRTTQYPNGTAVPVRYMVPAGYRQPSPPFANQSFNRYSGVPTTVHVPPSVVQPVRYPPGYAPPGAQMPYGSTMMPTGIPQQQPRQPEQLQPPKPYYYNPNISTPATPASTVDSQTPAAKKGAKEYKDKAFTIQPDAARSETIKGLVSNNEINDLLKHKGTKVKVAKIYRISKTKPDIKPDSSSDEELPLPVTAPVRQEPKERPVSSSSSCSHCSTCSNCSCSECRHRRRSHTYDDCPECRAEWEREQARRHRRK